MGVIKQKSDENILDNESELITPAKHREVNDVIDAQVEAANSSLSTHATNIESLQTSLTTLTETVTTNGVPDGGTTGQVLAKYSDTHKDTHWIDPQVKVFKGTFISDALGAISSIVHNLNSGDLHLTVWEGTNKICTQYTGGGLSLNELQITNLAYPNTEYRIIITAY